MLILDTVAAVFAASGEFIRQGGRLMQDVTKAEGIANSLETLRSGLFIVTSSHRNLLAGCTCVWVSRSSFSPPLMLVCLAPSRHTLGVIEQSKSFCINILGEGSLDLARKFGMVSGHAGNKFDSVAFHRGPNGSPILDEAISFLECKLATVTPIGDHRLVVGELVDGAVQHEREPLIYDPRMFYTSEEERRMMNQAG
jgi:flavin reductase (DIM6/NTAB) family NADH-FMN oxidoreductase RutF